MLPEEILQASASAPRIQFGGIWLGRLHAPGADFLQRNVDGRAMIESPERALLYRPENLTENLGADGVRIPSSRTQIALFGQATYDG